MKIYDGASASSPQSVLYNRCNIDLAAGGISFEEVPCQNLEDVLGGFGRSFQMLAREEITDAFAPQNPLIVNTGLLTGSDVMTGLRIYFSAYSPLKVSNKGLPAAMWSAGSGKFGCKFKWCGVDELVFRNKSTEPVLALLREGESGPSLELKPAQHLLGLDSHEKIMALQKEYGDAHFAVIGTAGENFENVYFAAVALSTENQLKSGDDKSRWAGRGGMGSVMGSKNLIAIVAQAKDKFGKLTPALRDLNREISGGVGSRKFREKKKGGLGGTWANYEPLQKLYLVPENNFRPTANDGIEEIFRDNLEDKFFIKAESCFRCGIHCHKNMYTLDADGKQGEFLAKFDYEPLNLLSTNLGVHDPHQAAKLIKRVDLLGMDSISCGSTISYVLDYNSRHPETPLANGATFGDFEKIMELVEETGQGRLPQVGRGVKRLADQMNEPGYAMQVKGLELPAYLPDTNPGYPWAIAGGHMSMYTFLLLALEGNTSMDYWVKAITERGYAALRDDMTGACKFAGISPDMALTAIKEASGLEVDQQELQAAIRRAFLRGLVLERKQGYEDGDYTLPAQVFENPNGNLKTENFITPEFFTEMKAKVWEVLEPEMEAL
ncbi:MAG: aldehyde:ferredoxin oxidoreductase [SAR324 cluster bacterium]|nr:aldehyde:ferredoxin oxidoreductase [SAR324 cluster bacterium]MCZ6843102.1 aldehyde:ferredoxin oxidoreductase [SAR324 cluster bacterium]